MSTLNIGCGMHPLKGAINHDFVKHDDWVDVAHDLEVLPWPWADNEFDKVIANDVMEHLRPWVCDLHEWLNELWRIIVPGGSLCLHLPAWNVMESYRDPTHRRVFTEETFDYWDRSKMLHQQFGRYYKGLVEYQRWWKVESVQRDYPEQRYGDIGFVLRKDAE
jgi:SAM-dependent methyltransferase